jgi:WD40 repeat protein
MVADGHAGAATQKLKVFISYARTDMAFADRLVAALEARGIEVLIDRRDLPLLEEWQRELVAFIRKADAVVYLVSPASIHSRWCEWEIGEVLAQNKRLAPIVIAMVPDNEIPEAIRRINFIPFTPPNDFEPQADKLRAALMANLGWLKEHTRLADLARRWDERGRPDALLMRGQDIAAAEQWLINRPGEAPRPTDLHAAFITASRLAQIRRQRMTAAGSVVAAAVFAMLAGVALWQWRQATASLTDSRSRELVLLGEANIVSDPQLTLALAIEAAEATQGAAGASEKLAFTLLRRAVLATPRRLTPDPMQVEAFAIKPGGASIVVGTSGGGVAELSLADGRVLRQAKVGDWIDTIDWNTDGSLLAVGARNRRVVIFDASSAMPVETLELGFMPQSVHWRKSTRQLAIGLANANNSVTQVYDLDAKKALFEAPGMRAAWSPDGSLLATGGGDGIVRVLTALGEIRATMPGHSRYVHKVVWNPEGNLFATASVDNRVMVWDALALKRVATLDARFALSAAWSPDGRFLACGTGSRFVNVWETSGFSEVFTITDTLTLTGGAVGSGPAGYILEVAWTDDGRKLVLSDREKGILTYSSRLVTAKTDADWLAAAKDQVLTPLSAADLRQRADRALDAFLARLASPGASTKP